MKRKYATSFGALYKAILALQCLAMALSVDEVLERIGSFGWYQLRLVMILSYIEWFSIGYQVMLLSFVAAEPPWHCAPNSTLCTLEGEFKPGDDNYDFRCGENVTRADWEFSSSFTSIVTEFNLTCGDAVLASVSSSVIFAGWILGSILGGYLSDRVGRKPVTVVFIFLCSLFGAIGASPNVFWFFVLCRLLVGFSIGAGGMSIFVLATEFVGVRHRHISGTSLWFSWTLSLMTLAGFAYAVRDWRHLTLVCSIPGLITILSWWFIPESARYLLLKGKREETEAVLRKVAAVNKKSYPEETLKQPPAQKTGDFRDLFRTKKMLHRTLISWYAWLVNALVYYGVSFSAPNLGGNMYLNFFLTSIIEIPANVAGIWAMGRLGRKKSVVGGLIVAFLASVGAVLISMYDPGKSPGFYAGTLIMAMTAKFFVMISFDGVYVYSAELFPTVIRNVGMGTSTSAARIGSFCAPYVNYLYKFHPLLPYSIMGINALVASLLCLTLPETKGMPTEETLSTNTGQEMSSAVKRGQVAPVTDKEPEPAVIVNSHANPIDEQNC